MSVTILGSCWYQAVSAPEAGAWLERARAAGEWVNADLTHLDRASLIAWLFGLGDSNLLNARNRATSIVLHLLGHKMLGQEDGA